MAVTVVDTVAAAKVTVVKQLTVAVAVVTTVGTREADAGAATAMTAATMDLCGSSDDGDGSSKNSWKPRKRWRRDRKSSSGKDTRIERR